nr:MAG TPA: Smc4, Condensin complex subunit 2, SMC complex, ATPase, chromosome [Caudoviricetes sp.]
MYHDYISYARTQKRATVRRLKRTVALFHNIVKF